jgi:nucleoid-associated protein YgaU/DNA-binding SARP family transcriptional activator
MTSRRLREVGRGLVALVVLGVLLVGPPVGLASFVGWPLPTTIPSFAEVEQAVRVGIDDAVVVKALAVLAWLLWVQVALAVTSEATAAVRRRSPRHQSVVPGLQAAVARLVASATLVATSVTPLHAAAATPVAPEPVAQLVPTPSLAAAAGLTAEPVPSPATPRLMPAPAPVDDAHMLQVRRHDSWWAIAERTLGDGLRWRELRYVNVGRTMPDGHTIIAGSELLRPGWVLNLPVDATVPEDQEREARPISAEPRPSPPGAPDPTVVSADGNGAEVAVVAGDSMWRIAERHLAVVLGRPASTPEVAIYWAGFVEANRGHFLDPTNPDLIQVGQRFVLPAVPGVLAPSAPRPDTAGAEPAPAPTPPPANEGSPPTSTPTTTSQAETSSSVPRTPDTTATTDGARDPAPPAPDVGTPPPTTRPADTTVEPSPTTQPERGDEDGSSSSPAPLLVGAISVLLAVGVTRAVRRRRRRRNHLAPDTAPSATSDPAFHRRLLADADENQTDTLGRALGNLATGVAKAGHACRPLVVQHGPDHLDVLLDRPTRPAVDGWHVQADGDVWTADPSQLRAEVPGTAPGTAMPLLVTVGQPEDGGQLYLDLEAARLVTLTGDPGSARDLAVTMVTELAHSPLAANAQLVVVGDDLGAVKLADLDRVKVTATWAGVAADLAAWNEQSHDALAANDWPNPFAARGHDPDHDALIPFVVIATRLPDDLDLLGALTAGPATTAAVIVGDALPGATVVDCQPDQLSLPQLGLTCRPLTLTPQEVDAVAELLDAAEDTKGEQLVLGLDQDLAAGPTDAPDGMDEPYYDPPYEILVRFLGDITVEGGVAPLTGKQTALVAYIALHRSVSADRVSDAVWVAPAAVSDRKRLANTVNKCRGAIGARHLPAATDRGYTIGPDVATDVDLFEGRVAAAAQMPPEQAVETLCSALDLVRSRVFEYPSTASDSYSWVDVENWVSTWELNVTTVAERTVDLCIDLGNPAAAAHVAERTLRAVPTHSGLTEALMRAHAANGDRLAVQRVYQAHVNALETLDLDSVADSTAELYERLRAG